MDSALSKSASSLAIPQDSLPSLASPHAPAAAHVASAKTPTRSSVQASAATNNQVHQATAVAEVELLAGLGNSPWFLTELELNETLLDRRGLTGPQRSVEVVGDKLMAFGRPVLSGVPEAINARACKYHDGPAAADVQGIFLGSSSLDPSSRHVFSLGTLRDTRFMGCFRFSMWWMTQATGNCGQEVPVETQFMLIECPPLRPESPEASMLPRSFRDGPASNQAIRDSDTVYVAVLPVLEGAFRASLQGNAQDQLQVCAESGDPMVMSSEAREAVFVHAGRNPFRTISEAVRAVEAHLGTFARRETKQLPDMLDQFGWCTWDAFYTDVTAEGVIDGLTSLKAGGTPANFLLIDDGWQTVADPSGAPPDNIGKHWKNRLASVEENQKFKDCCSEEGTAPSTAAAAGTQEPEGAPHAAEGEVSTELSTAVAGGGRLGVQGLGRLVRQLKDQLDVKYVYVWHAIMGYWGGVLPSQGMERFAPTLSYPQASQGILENNPDFAEDALTLHGLNVVDPARAGQFYDELHGYLAACGVDGVKVDSQDILETLGEGRGGRVALTRTFQTALEASIRKNFRNNDIICCMSHNTDSLYSWKQNAVMRVSDDFWPTKPATHTAHIIGVAYNSLFLGEFMQPDWDMFHSLHPAAEFHGAARAVGGCAVYVSDKPKHHDFAILKKLVLPDGTTLRAQLPGRPTRDCLFVDPARDTKSLLKVWNMNPCNGVVAAFNCQGAAWSRDAHEYTIHNPEPGTVVGVVSAEDVDSLADMASYDWTGDIAVYSHFEDELVTLPYRTNLVLSLPPLKCEVYTMAPIKVLGNTEFAPIGFHKMYNSGGAIVAAQYSFKDRSVEEDSSMTATHGASHRATLYAKGGGRLMVYSSTKPLTVLLEGAQVNYDYCAEDGRLLIDMEVATEALRLDFDY